MGVEGIGASVVRKEDKRFITGKGRYTDDIRLHGMTHAHFIRSPHAHAKVKSIDSAEAMKMPGVVAVLTGKETGRRQDRQPDLRLDDPLQGRHADEDGRLPGDGAGDRALCRTGGRGRDRREQEPGARRGREASIVTYEELPAVADIRAAIAPGAPQLHPEAPGNVVYDWALGDEAATNAAFAKAANVVSIELTNNRLVPNAMEPRVGDRRLRHRGRALHALHHLAEPARRPPRAVGVLQHRAGAQAARDRAGRRRRLRLENLHLSRKRWWRCGRRRRSAAR